MMSRNAWVGCGLFILASRAFACEISLAYNSDALPPYYVGVGDVSPDHPGVAVELAQLAAAKIGCAVTLKRLPTKRVMAETGMGKYDGAFLFSYSVERTAIFAFPMQGEMPDKSRRIATLSYSLYKLKGSPANWNGETFSGISGPIGVNMGWSIGKDIQALKVPVLESYTTQENFNQLRLGRIAAYATLDTVGDAAIQRAGMNDIERLPTLISSKDYFIIFNNLYYQKNRERTEQFWTAIGNLRESTLQSLIKKYSTD
ncbi:substrate-binding periplasmic protein [Chitinimonas sp. PSY-7]|uniref:substrate-binding periplasmic protein n=1 Tax=Chitinimonas sp. PSY-7 TaxID=3459088 RepID=UPI00403FD208